MKQSLLKRYRVLAPAIGIIFSTGAVQAAPLKNALEDLVYNHKRILAATADLEGGG